MADVPVPGSELTGRAGGRRPIAAPSRPPSRDLLADALGGRPRRVRRRRLAARRPPRARARRLGPRLGRPARAGRRALPGRGLREPVRDGRRPPRRRATSRSRPSGPTTTTPTSGGRTGSSSATRSSSTSRAATSRSTRSPGARGPASRRRLDRPVRRARRRRRRGCSAPSATRRPASRRTRCGWSAPSASRRRSASTIEAATLAGIRGARRPRRATCRASGSRPSSTSCSPRRSPSVGLRLLAETGLLAAISPELAAQRGVAQNKVPGEDLWDHTLRAVDAAPAGAAGRPARGAPPRHRQAGDVRRRPVPRPRRGRRRAGRRVPRPAARAARRPRPRRRPRPPPHVQLRADLVRRGGPAVHRQDGGVGDGPRRPVRAARGGQRRIGAAGRRRAGSTSSGRGSRPSSRPTLVLDRRGLAIDGDDLIDGAGPRAGTALGRILDELLERVIADPALNDRPTLLLAGPGDDARTERRDDRAAAPGRARAVGRAARSRGDALPPGRATPTRGTRSRSSGSPGSRSSAATSSRRLELGRRALAIDPENAAAQRLVAAARGGACLPRRGARSRLRAACAGARARRRSRAGTRARARGRARTTERPARRPAPAGPPSEAAPDAPPRARSWLDRLLRRNR